MMVVIFEVEPHSERKQDYFDLAAALRPHLEKIDGCIPVERFESPVQPGKILSLSFWRDEQAIQAWREAKQHRAAQHSGREQIFADYRLRIASVVRDYGMFERAEALQEMPLVDPPAGSRWGPAASDCHRRDETYPSMVSARNAPASMMSATMAARALVPSRSRKACSAVW